MKPNMILFDYGQTLVVEPQFDAKLGYAAVYDRTDGGSVDCDTFCDYADALFGSLAEKAHGVYREVDNVRFLSAICTYFGMTSAISYADADLLFWDTATHGSYASPHAAEMLAALHARGIRIGVVSNLSFARHSLEARLSRYLPHVGFEFVVTSSDLLFRKPERFIFDYALRKADLPSEAVWFVGDNPTADIFGAHRAGMRPILYTNEHMRRYDVPIDVPYTPIDDLADLIALVDKT